MALFTDLYADIGDAQDLSRDLSSFSAHMMYMIRLLSESISVPRSLIPLTPCALVLLDEPVTSTDPQEGAALAEALLCCLAELNMKVVATTHYGALKELAQTTPGFVNASVEFDVERLAPTYRLFMGIPGGSSALEIAGRLGMDHSILNDARKRLLHEDRRLDELMVDLQRRQRQLVEDSEKAQSARQEAEQAAREAQMLRAQLQEAEQEARRGLKKKLGEQFQRARAEVQATVDSLKREQKLIKAKETKQRLHELETKVRQDLVPAGKTISLEQLGIGDTVEIVGLGMTGSLLETTQGKKCVRVKGIEQTYGVSSTLFKKELKEGLEIVENHYQVKPIIYTNVDFYSRYLGKEFNSYPLWAAHYFQYDAPRIDRNWDFWQHSEEGRVNGILSKVDFNVFNGDSLQFKSILLNK